MIDKVLQASFEVFTLVVYYEIQPQVFGVALEQRLKLGLELRLLIGRVVEFSGGDVCEYPYKFPSEIGRLRLFERLLQLLLNNFPLCLVFFEV